MNRVRIVAVTAVALGGVISSSPERISNHRRSQRGAAGRFRRRAGIAGRSSAAPSDTVRSLDGLATAPALTGAAGPEPVTAQHRPAARCAPADLPAASILPRVQRPARATIAGRRPPMPLAGGAPPLRPSAAPAAAATVPLDPQLQAELNACAVWLVVTPAANAMLETSVYAPCDAGEQVTLSHAGLTFGRAHRGAMAR